MMPIDYRRYPANWHSEIVPAIFERSKGYCEQCGREHGAMVYSFEVRKQSMGKITYRRDWTFGLVVPELPKMKLVQVILTVAHLDHDATNHNVSLDRLKHLCQLCHLRLDARQKATKRLCGRFCTFPKCYGPDCYDLNDEYENFGMKD